MEIRALELLNVKSYERESIAFARGTNAICGPNGAGKSTILEAIGYALFDVAPCRPISNLVREGEKTGAITVTVAANDGREYQVIRKCGAQSHYYVYDPEIGQRLADGGVDVLAWLREQFGVEETVDLPALFRDAVGVPQGLLTAAFLQASAARKTVFNPLLRVEEYSQAWQELRETRRALDERTHAREMEIAGYRAEVRALPELEERAAALASELDEDQARLDRLEAELAAMEKEKGALEAARDRVQKLAQDAGRLDERIAGLGARARLGAEAVAQARAAQRTLEESEAGHLAYLAAQKSSRALEAQREARARLQQEMSEAQARQQVTAERLARLEQGLQESVAAAAEAERLRPAAEEQAHLQSALQEAQAHAAQWEAASRRLGNERGQLAEVEARLSQVGAGLEELARLEGEREGQRRRLDELTLALEAMQADQARQRAALDQLEQQREALAQVEAAQCPVCEGELEAERRAEILERNHERAALVRGILQEGSRQGREVKAQRQAASEALQALEKRTATLPRPREQAALQAQAERLRRLVGEAEAEVARLAEARARAQALSAKLDGLGDPRRAYDRAQDAAARRPALEAEMAEQRLQAAALDERLAGLRGKLEAFARLDVELAAAREELSANEPLHQRYLLHQRIAEELPARLAQLRGLEADLESARGERGVIAAELAAAQQAYDPQEYERVAQAHRQVSDERSALSARVEMRGRQLEEMRAGVTRLREVAERLQAAEGDLGTWQDVGRLLEYLRKVLKEAGPQVTRVLVEVISHQAARLFADITSDHAARLRWSEDYEVLVRHGAYERTFQQLSGGEQMAAALAVRLALLREISEIDVVFFDEPTSNLDDTRRDNLAEQILGIKDFSQLFVVSHDDTFERATDHVVRLAKVDGASRVVA